MTREHAEFRLTIPKTILLLLSYIGIGFAIPVIIDALFEDSMTISIRLAIEIALNIAFFIGLAKFTRHPVSFTTNITATNALFGVLCALLLYIIMDGFFDPLFDRLFPASAVQYGKMLTTMKEMPVATFVQVCLIAPITEELIMRRYILHGLMGKYGALVAVLLSTLLFAVLHINLGQIFSAFIGGTLIALLYIKTRSISCCILSHVIYNSISFFTTIIH